MKLLLVAVRIKNLHTLILHGAKNITDKGFEVLANHPRLRTLNVACTNAGDKALHAFRSMKALTDLDVWNCENMTAQGFQVLAEYPSLQKLNLLGYHADDTTLVALQSIKTLRELRISDSLFCPN